MVFYQWHVTHACKHECTLQLLDSYLNMLLSCQCLSVKPSTVASVHVYFVQWMSCNFTGAQGPCNYNTCGHNKLLLAQCYKCTIMHMEHLVFLTGCRAVMAKVYTCVQFH